MRLDWIYLVPQNICTLQMRRAILRGARSKEQAAVVHILKFARTITTKRIFTQTAEIKCYYQTPVVKINMFNNPCCN